jgi:hypothetical protein
MTALVVQRGIRSPDGAQRHPGRVAPHFALLNAGYEPPQATVHIAAPMR